MLAAAIVWTIVVELAAPRVTATLRLQGGVEVRVAVTRDAATRSMDSEVVFQVVRALETIARLRTRTSVVGTEEVVIGNVASKEPRLTLFRRGCTVVSDPMNAFKMRLQLRLSREGSRCTVRFWAAE